MTNMKFLAALSNKPCSFHERKTKEYSYQSYCFIVKNRDAFAVSNSHRKNFHTREDSFTPKSQISNTSPLNAKQVRDVYIGLSSVIGEMFEAEFGPKGSKKLMTVIQDELGWAPNLNDITSDGYTIIYGANLKNPIGKIITETAKTVDTEVGDGVKTTIILIGKLMQKAQKLIGEGLHPRTIIDGYQKAWAKTVEIANSLAVSIDPYDNASIRKIASTAMSNKIAQKSIKHITDLVAKATQTASEKEENGRKLDLSNIKVEKIENGLLSESYVFNGWVIEFPMSRFGMPERVENAKITFITRPIEAFSMGQLSKYENLIKIDVTKKEHIDGFSEKKKEIAQEMALKIASSGANVIISNWNIDDAALEYFSNKGISAFKRVLMPDLTKIQKVTGGILTDNIDELTPKFFGSSKLILTQKLYEKTYAFFTGKEDSLASTIILRGGSKLFVDEAYRGINDGLSAIREFYKDPRIVYGGGAFEIEIASQLKAYANQIKTKEQLAVNAFAQAFEDICAVLCKNAGMNLLDTLPMLKLSHAKGEKKIGINSARKEAGDMERQGVCDPIRVKLQAINSAFETAELILRIDYLMAAKPSETPESEEPKSPEDIDKIEQKMVPKIMEKTAENYKEPWEQGLE